ncbi:MAG: N-acetyltransferase [Candidatus Eremiobacteraeota bacterium]|nr:N-acetyltransferase [Candidatus Eremiobacteraeota bacterium]MCW5867977.1 N-acetyltransferase [Candidatus Eremiobacteraeota bacterium]
MSQVHFLRQPPPAELGRALVEFEEQFTYPLGANDSFSISHGPEYVTFFQAIGEAVVLVVEEEGRVLGTLAAVLRPLRIPQGQVHRVAYLADLKMVREVRFRLPRYLRAMSEHLQVPSNCGYAVVMDGTRSTPDRYTGRGSIPSFRTQAKVTVLSLRTRLGNERDCEVDEERLNRRWAESRPAGAVVPLSGQSRLRSERAPLALEWGSACGLLEDTRRGKRLLHTDGTEMRAAHLSRFLFENERDGAALLEQAARRCAREGIPVLFACLPESAAQRLLPHLRQLQVLPAPATVYAVGFPPDWSEWWLDSAEI